MLCIYLATDRIFFSVQSEINKGSAINLTPNFEELSAPDGTQFATKKDGKLYYLNSTISSSGAHTAETRHRILGHCNMNDVFKGGQGVVSAP